MYAHIFVRGTEIGAAKSHLLTLIVFYYPKVSIRKHESATWKSVRVGKSLKTNWKVVENFPPLSADNVKGRKFSLSLSSQHPSEREELSVRFWAIRQRERENFVWTPLTRFNTQKRANESKKKTKQILFGESQQKKIQIEFGDVWRGTIEGKKLQGQRELF